MTFWSFKLSVQFSLVAQSCPTLCNPMDCSSPGLPVHQKLLESIQTHVLWVGDAIQWTHPLSSPSLPAFNLSPASGSFPVSQFFTSSGQIIGASASASVLLRNIQDWFPSRLTGFISLQVQGTLKSLLQHHSSKASILHYSAFMVQSSHPYMTTGKTMYINYPYTLLRDLKYSSLCYTVGHCYLFYILWSVYVNPKLLIDPSPLLFGN